MPVQVRYYGPDGLRHKAPMMFGTKTEARRWLSMMEADLARGRWDGDDSDGERLATYRYRLSMASASVIDPDEADTPLGDEPAREPDARAEHDGRLIDAQQLSLHDQLLFFGWVGTDIRGWVVGCSASPDLGGWGLRSARQEHSLIKGRRKAPAVRRVSSLRCGPRRPSTAVTVE